MDANFEMFLGIIVGIGVISFIVIFVFLFLRKPKTHSWKEFKHTNFCDLPKELRDDMVNFDNFEDSNDFVSPFYKGSVTSTITSVSSDGATNTKTVQKQYNGVIANQCPNCGTSYFKS